MYTKAHSLIDQEIYVRSVQEAYEAIFDDGNCAVSEKKVGKGRVVNINTHLWYGYEKTEMYL